MKAQITCKFSYNCLSHRLCSPRHYTDETVLDCSVSVRFLIHLNTNIPHQTRLTSLPSALYGEKCSESSIPLVAAILVSHEMWAGQANTFSEEITLLLLIEINYHRIKGNVRVIRHISGARRCMICERLLVEVVE